jgi:SAM-dependent methyltransferase
MTDRSDGDQEDEIHLVFDYPPCNLGSQFFAHAAGGINSAHARKCVRSEVAEATARNASTQRLDRKYDVRVDARCGLVISEVTRSKIGHVDVSIDRANTRVVSVMKRDLAGRIDAARRNERESTLPQRSPQWRPGRRLLALEPAITRMSECSILLPCAGDIIDRRLSLGTHSGVFPSLMLPVNDEEQGSDMDQLATDGPNAQQIEYWNHVSGDRWVDMGDVIDAQIAPLGEAAMERARIAPGERVLDIGCGCGQTTLELATRVGADGSVLGLDISNPMLARARERAGHADLGNVEFQQADAQIYEFDAAGFDLLFSRFGVMFFSSPVEAFTNLLSALRPGGRLVFVAWQELIRNPWMHLPIVAASKHLPPGGPPPDPSAPGPFAFASRERVEAILRDSGFVNIQHESLERDLLVGGGRSLDESVEFVAQLGPAGAALRDADTALRNDIMSEIRRVIEPFHKEDGVHMPSATWIVSAERPTPG